MRSELRQLTNLRLGSVYTGFSTNLNCTSLIRTRSSAFGSLFSRAGSPVHLEPIRLRKYSVNSPLNACDVLS
jgi:hypothetical protein